MRYLLAFPLIALVLIAYNVMAFTDQGWLWAEAMRVDMMSGASLVLQWADCGHWHTENRRSRVASRHPRLFYRQLYSERGAMDRR